MSVRLASMQRKRLVAESAIRSDIQIVKLAEIMCIQFKQVSQDRLVLAQGEIEVDTQGWLICMFSHSWDMRVLL